MLPFAIPSHGRFVPGEPADIAARDADPVTRWPIDRSAPADCTEEGLYYWSVKAPISPFGHKAAHRHPWSVWHRIVKFLKREEVNVTNEELVKHLRAWPGLPARMREFSDERLVDVARKAWGQKRKQAAALREAHAVGRFMLDLMADEPFDGE